MTLNVFDTFGDRTRAFTPVNATVTKDGSGNYVPSADSVPTATTYDRLGRVAEVKTTEWQRVSYAYDASGNKLSVIDKVHPSWYTGAYGDSPLAGPDAGHALTTTTRYTFDALGRTVTVQEPPDAVANPETWTGFRYDAAGRVDRVWDRLDRMRFFAHDALGRTTHEFWVSQGSKGPVLNNAVVATFDAFDHLTRTYESAGAGVSVAAAYTDPLFSPDATDPSLGYSKSETAVENTFDSAGRLATSWAWPGKVTYGYDAAGRVVALTVGAGGTQESGYDLAGRLAWRSVREPGGQGAYFTFAYKPAPAGGRLDLVQQVIGRNGATPTGGHVTVGDMTYDEFGRETSRGWWYAGNPAAGHKELVTTTYEPGRGLVQVEDRTGSVPADLRPGNVWAKYTYDKLGQVATIESKIDGVTQKAYATNLDASGNPPLHSTLAPPPGTTERPDRNRPLRLGDWSAEYDAEGNVTRLTAVGPPAAPVGERRYAYDHRNRLVRAEFWTYSPAAGYSKDRTVLFAHDPLDRLAERATLNQLAVTERYVYDGRRVVADTGWADEFLRRYAYGPSGEPVGRVDAARPLFYLGDRQGSVLSVADASGSAVKRVRYDRSHTAWRGGTEPGDRPELGGAANEWLADVQWLGGRPLVGAVDRFVTAGGGATGLNPYPFAGNSTPNANLDVGNDYTTWYGDAFYLATGASKREARAWAGYLLADKPLPGGGTPTNGQRFTKGVVGKFADAFHVVPDAAEFLRYGVGQVTGLGSATDRPDFGSQMFKGWFAVAKTDQAGAFLWQAVQGMANPTRPAQEAGARGYATGDWGDFWEEAGGLTGQTAATAVQLAVPGPKGLAGVRATFAARGVGAGLGATVRLGVRVTAAAVASNVLPVGAGLAARGLGRATGWSARGVFRTGNQGDQTNALSRLVHAADGTHKPGAKAWAARHVADWTHTKVCFTGRMPMRTPAGSTPARAVRTGDLLLSRDERDPEGLVVAQRVEEVFVRWGLVTVLGVSGIEIETTSEHPYYVRGRGWTACRELRLGDVLRLEDGWATVEGVAETGRWEEVYNFRIGEYHTYFVGCPEWGFSVWAHNTYTGKQTNAVLEVQGVKRLRGGRSGQLARLVDEGYEVKVRSFLEGYGIKGVAQDNVVAALFRDAKVMPKVGQPPQAAVLGVSQLTRADLVPPTNAPVGATYLVNGQKPIRIDLTDLHWESKLPANTLSSGVYIVRTRGGQILKPGDTSDLAGRMSEYRRWHVEDGLDVVVDFYPMRADYSVQPPIRLQRVANDIRSKLEVDNWNLPRDWENIGPNPLAYQRAKVTRAGE